MPFIKVPDGEDEHSFSQHNKHLLAEYRKSHPNLVLVNDLMDRSFAQRRKDITETGYSAVESLFEVYPFLQDGNQLMLEMCRILQKSSEYIEEAATIWNDNSSKIVETQNKTLQTVIKGSDGLGKSILGLIYLSYLLPDVRTKPNHNGILQLAEDGDNIEETVSNISINHPYVTLIVSTGDTHLVTDRKVICQIEDSNHIPFILLAAYFVYYIKYPRGFNNFFSFMEILQLMTPIKKVSPSIQHLLSYLYQ